MITEKVRHCAALSHSLWWNDLQGTPLERQRKMKTIKLKALPKIEAMRRMTCVTGIQVNTLALVVPCVVD